MFVTFITTLTLLLTKSYSIASSNLCADELLIKTTYGTVVHCPSQSSYSIANIKSKCPVRTVLAEILDAELYQKITNELTLSTGNKVKDYSIWINAKYDSIQGRYVWPSNGSPLIQYPHTYLYVDNHYISNIYKWRTTVLWQLSIPNSNSYLKAFESDVTANSILCLNEELLKVKTNPCSTTDQPENKYWFGTLVTCNRDVYTLNFAQNYCPDGQVLAEINDASLYQNITNEISHRTGNKVKDYSIWINAKYDSIQGRYVWPSNGSPLIQYPHTYLYVDNHYISNIYKWRTTVLWQLSIPNSNSYLKAFESDVTANSILCLNEELLKVKTNPCSTTDQPENKYWFGTLVTCNRDVYTLNFAQNYCPDGQVLAEINDASLYQNITKEISYRTGNRVKDYSIWINAKYDSIQGKYVWPSNGSPLIQYPHTYLYVDNHYISNTYKWRTTVLWQLSIPNSNSYLKAFESDVTANSILCLNEESLKENVYH